ncbi:zinc finger, C2H2 type [Oesophagostomum dentatum]|uniref:Zinc finger, C2H2 type n=1 Tax=Oesophagostomum dentatum TaxID=61180 RepID=A0A0B1SW16_OESDE|nr:zinc finger, C2H2 type [Oesophagostomum dentatum]
MDLPHEVVYHHHLPVDTNEEDMRMMEDQVEAQMDDIEYGGDVTMDGPMAEPRAVHQLKGNLKKHLKTHVTSKDELERAWRPFACNRRPAADIPDDAIIVRGTGDPFFTPPSRPRKKKLGLGPDPSAWIDKIRRGEILPGTSLQTKMMRLETLLKNNEFSLEEIFEQARTIAFENSERDQTSIRCFRFDCPMCRSQFFSRAECYDHLEIEHPMARIERPLFCEICLKVFADRKSLEQHESYHKRVHLMIDNNEIEFTDPEILLPESCDFEEEDLQGVPVIH